LVPVLRSIITNLQSIQRYIGPLEIIDNSLVDMKFRKESDAGDERISEIKKGFKFNNLSYKYPNSVKNNLSNISFEINTGELVAIIGESGSGKSTLIDFLPGLRFGTSGNLLLDGVDIRNYSLRGLRDLISFVPQDPYLFNGRIIDHIMYGNRNASYQQVLDASELAGCKNFISELPNGFETEIKNNGVSFSGGQRQRIDLARSILQNRQVLILDEPTSKLDASNEKHFIDSLTELSKNKQKIIIVITHKLNIVEKFNKFIIMSNGQSKMVSEYSDLHKENFISNVK